MEAFSKIAIRNVFKNWRHSLAATISISAGFISLVLFQGYILDVEDMYHVSMKQRAMYGDLIIENEKIHSKEGRSNPSLFQITDDQQKLIQNYLDGRKDEVLHRVRFLPTTGVITNGKNSFVFIGVGYDVDEGVAVRGREWRWDALYGQPLHIAKEANPVMLGQSLGYFLGCVPDEQKSDFVQNGGNKEEVVPFHCENYTVQLSSNTESGQVNAIDLNVVGIVDGGYREVDEKWIKMSLKDAQALQNTNKIQFMTLSLADSKKWQAFRNDLSVFFKANNLPLRAVNWVEHPAADLFLKIMSLLNIFKVFIVLVIMVISGLSVFNTMVKIVKERTKEIGTLRSLGFTSQQVGQIFTFEAAYLSLLGIFVGMLAAIFVTIAVNLSHIHYRAGMLSEPVLFVIRVDIWTYCYSTVLLVILAVATSWLATRHVMRGSVAENLTYA